MNVLLLSMPDSFEHMPSIVIRMPNGALTSLAGNVDPHHRVAVADLILAQKNVRRTVEQLVREWQPQVIGLSVMTFQRKTAIKIISLIRSLKPDVKVAVGGYDPSLASEPYMTNDAGVDFIIRGEGERSQLGDVVPGTRDRRPVDRRVVDFHSAATGGRQLHREGED